MSFRYITAISSSRKTSRLRIITSRMKRRSKLSWPKVDPRPLKRRNQSRGWCLVKHQFLTLKCKLRSQFESRLTYSWKLLLRPCPDRSQTVTPTRRWSTRGSTRLSQTSPKRARRRIRSPYLSRTPRNKSRVRNQGNYKCLSNTTRAKTVPASWSLLKRVKPRKWRRACTKRSRQGKRTRSCGPKLKASRASWMKLASKLQHLSP